MIRERNKMGIIDCREKNIYNNELFLFQNKMTVRIK